METLRAFILAVSGPLSLICAWYCYRARMKLGDPMFRYLQTLFFGLGLSTTYFMLWNGLGRPMWPSELHLLIPNVASLMIIIGMSGVLVIVNKWNPLAWALSIQSSALKAVFRIIR